MKTIIHCSVMRLLTLFILLLVSACSPVKASNNLSFPSSLDWFNVSRDLTVSDVKGKVVILDFWTYGCVNCVHVLPDLDQLERDFGEKLAVISVHSPKFDNEKNPITLRNIVARYQIKHAVANDIDFKIWRNYGVRAWPTFVVFGPDGEYAGQLSGEGQYSRLKQVTQILLDRFEGKLNNKALPIQLEKMPAGYLKAPGKITASETLLVISDSLNHRIIVTDHDGKVLHEIGGFADQNINNRMQDGDFKSATFFQPQGVIFGDASVNNDQIIFVADTGNHAIRKIDLQTKTVSTIAGTGQLGRTYTLGDNPIKTDLRSPWALAKQGNDLYIAMAGTHQIWKMDLESNRLNVFAGSGREQLTDGNYQDSAFNQPSGLSIQGNKLYVADSEASAIRVIDLKTKKVSTVVGKGLFDFGDTDGAFSKALLQHTLGVIALNAETLIIADTYNHKLKKVNLKSQTVSAIKSTVDQLNEPGGLARWKNKIFVADTNNQAIKVLDLNSGQLTTLDIKPN